MCLVWGSQMQNDALMENLVFWIVVNKSNAITWARRLGGLMVSALASGSSRLGLSPGRGHCVVFLGGRLNSHSASLHPGVQMATGELNAGGNPVID